MNDPHVETLTYRLEAADGITFEAPPKAWSNNVADFELKDGLLTARPKNHHAKIESARSDVDSAVRAWEVYGGLTYGSDDFRFRFLQGETIDRCPTPGVVTATATLTATAS